MTHRKHWNINDIPFQRKIMLSFLLILLLPMTFVITYTYQRFVYGEQMRIEQQLQREFALLTEETGEKLLSAEETAKKVAANPMLSSYFNNYEHSALDNVQFAHQYFSTFVDWLESFSNLDVGLHFYTRNRSLFENKYVSCISADDSVRLQALIAAEDDAAPCWRSGASWPQKRFPIDAQTERQITFYSPMVSDNFFHSETVVALSLPYSELFDVLRTIDPEMLVLMRDSSKNVLFSRIPASMALDADTISDSVAALDQERYLYAETSFERYGLELLCLYPRQLARSNLLRVFLLFMLCILALVGLFVAGTYLISRSLTRRLTIITNTMRSVGDTGLDVRTEIDGRDEIGQLAHDFNKMMQRIRTLNEMTCRAEVLRRDATIKAMESEMDPHFLFNALQTISMMAEIKGELDISDAITSLGAIVRYNLSHGDDVIPLAQELEHVRTYCALQNLILNDRLRLETDVPQEFLPHRLPRMLLGPLVENCVLHGFRDFPGECRIRITLRSEPACLRLLVQDNGNGIAPARLAKLRAYLEEDWAAPTDLETSGNGLALRNVHQRIRLKYGESYGLTLRSTLHEGTCVCIALPPVDGGSTKPGGVLS